MKNVLRVNHVDRTIVMDRTFARYAMDTRSDEYAHLQRVRLDYPNYTVVQRQINRNPEKKTYCGLTYPQPSITREGRQVASLLYGE